MADDAHDDDVWKSVTQGMTPLSRKKGRKPSIESPKKRAPADTEPSFAELLDEDPLKRRESLSQKAPDVDAWMHDSLLALSDVFRSYALKMSGRRTSAPSRSYPILDLHHMTEQKAHHSLVSFVETARKRGDKRVLVITGKSGVLFQNVPKWLRIMTQEVRTFEYAPASWGGEGALIVSLYAHPSIF